MCIRDSITRALIDPNVFSAGAEQLSMFAPPAVDRLVKQGVPDVYKRQR